MLRFLENCAMTLTHLSLGNCDFVRENSIEQIAQCAELSGNFSTNVYSVFIKSRIT